MNDIVAKSDLSPEIMQAIVEGRHGAPMDVLGPHTCPKDSSHRVIRTFQPYARDVSILGKEDRPMEKIHSQGLFEASVSIQEDAVYRLRMTGFDDHEWELEDPYRFEPLISDFDMYLYGEGSHYRTYRRMGAHQMTRDGVDGVHFSVWAPNAERVSILGWFNRWDGRHHPMQMRGDSGLWEIFMPALKPGDLYKYEIRSRNGKIAEKADPYAFASEIRPRTASMVWDNNGYDWHDSTWMKKRRETNWLEAPLSVYEVHPGSWKRREDDHDRWLTYGELAEEMIPYVKEMGFTHIELLPITEHPFDGSWGYQTIGYFAPTSRFGTPDDLKYFIDRCHREGIGVILDWVPAHFPKDEHGLAHFDGTNLYEHADPRRGEHMDWGTLIFNYGRNEVRSFLLSSAMYWADIFHIDGIRVDAVASMLYLDYSRKDGEWIPNQFGGRENLEAVGFLKKFNEVIHDEYPGILTFAEESTAWPGVSRPTFLGGLGFGMKWNMGWMHDSLQYFSEDSVHRKYHHNTITFSMLYAFTENFILPFSHDEVVHGKGSMLSKMPGDKWQRFANLRLLYAYMYAHPGKKLLFMGSEFGVEKEWDHDGSLSWSLLEKEPHRKLQHLVRDLNRLHQDVPALHRYDFSWDGFEWIDAKDDAQSVIAFVRKTKEENEEVVCVFNFTPVPREKYRIGVPTSGTYQEFLNTDSELYGGSNLGNLGVVESEPVAWQGREHSVQLTLPPLGAILLRKK